MAFNAANLAVASRTEHANGSLRVFTYSTSDSGNDTKGSSYFSDPRFFVAGDLIKVTHASGSYVGLWTSDTSGLSEI